MEEKIFATAYGAIHYWDNGLDSDLPALVFLPGLTADHRLFDRQIQHFQSSRRCLVWDAPGHGASRPFRLDFTLADKAKFLHGILSDQGIERPILVGQSMGGYVAQMFGQLYPGEMGALVCIDSAPLQRRYLTAAELWALEHVEPVYRLYPWKALQRAGSRGCATSPYGQHLMADMIADYRREEYCALAGHGFRILARAIADDLPYEPRCPVVLICGMSDRAGSTRRYNKAWAKRTGYPIHWLAGAGHNSNTDRPQAVNAILAQIVLP